MSRTVAFLRIDRRFYTCTAQLVGDKLKGWIIIKRPFVIYLVHLKHVNYMSILVKNCSCFFNKYFFREVAVLFLLRMKYYKVIDNKIRSRKIIHVV